MAKLLTATSARALPDIPVSGNLNTWESAEDLIEALADIGDGPGFSFNGSKVWSHNGNMYYNNTYTLADTGSWGYTSWDGPGFNFGIIIDGESAFSFNGTTFVLYSGSKLGCIKAGATYSTLVNANLTGFTISDTFDANNFWVHPEINDAIFYTNINTNIGVNEHYRVTQGTNYNELVFTSETLVHKSGASVAGIVKGSNMWADNTGRVYNTCTDDASLTFEITVPDTETMQLCCLYKSFTNIPYINGSDVWTDGVNTYASGSYLINGAYVYKTFKLGTDGKTWAEQAFKGGSRITPSNLWTDGVNIYHSEGTTYYKLSAPDISPCYLLENGEWVKQNVFQLQSGAWVQISSK